MSTSIFTKTYHYILIRFPPYQFFPLSFVFGFACTVRFSFFHWIYISFALLLYLFELRIFDEFKDYEHDKKYYPDRPVQNRLISLRELQLPLIITVLLQILLVVFIRPDILAFCFVQLYTLLMSREFFIKKWLEKHFSVYIMLHELITPFLFLYLISFGVHNISMEIIFSSIFLGINLFFLEIGRKLAPREPTHLANDTYVERYSNKGVVVLISVLTTVSAILLVRITHRFTAVIPLFCYSPILIYLLYKYTSDKWEKHANMLFIGLICMIVINLASLSVYRY